MIAAPADARAIVGIVHVVALVGSRRLMPT
jgi:hypothetical protein